MKIKEATNREVHWLFPKLNIGDQANDRVLGKLGDLKASFAPVYSGNSGSFQWHSNDAGWTALTAATPEVQERVREEWAKIQREVSSRLSADTFTAECVLMIPNEEYIFYKLMEDGTMRLLITGWGFENFRRPEFMVQKPEIANKTTQSVSIRMTREGEPVSNAEVVIPTKNGLNALYTGEDGVLRMPTPLNLGQEFRLQHPASGVEKQFTVIKGKEEYEWDITQTTQVSVRAVMDDKPLAGTFVIVSYHGKDHRLVLDANGTAFIDDLAHHPGDMCRVVLGGDQTQERELEVDSNNLFDFSVNTPEQTPPPPPDNEKDKSDSLPPSPPEMQQFRLTVLDHAGKPYVGMNISLQQGLHVDTARLNEQGLAVVERRSFADYEPVNVQLNSPAQKFPPVTFTLEPEEDDYVIQEKIENPSPLESTLMQILIVLLAAIFLTIIGYLTIHFLM